MYKFQLSLFYDLRYLIQTSSFYRKNYPLFSALDLSSIPDINADVGRTGYSRHAMLRAFIIKHQERIKTIPDLLRFPDSHPALTEMCGFTASVLPNESQFYRFLKEARTSLIENLMYGLNKELIHDGVISLNDFILDSKPIIAATRENNFKNPKRNTRDKNHKPKRNPAATLGYYSYQSINGQKNNFVFFWGYRTHVIVSKEGVPLVALTLPNNQTDDKVAIKLIKKLKRVYRFKKGACFIADAAYDVRELYNFIVDQIKGYAFIPINPRNTQPDKTLGPNGWPLCEAGFEMTPNGTWQEGLRRRLKFRCPIKADKCFAVDHPACPIGHHCFSQGKAYGCTKYLDITDDARARVPRNTKRFKDKYRLRMEVERYFARLGDREAEQTTHYKNKSIQNQMAIAHLSMSLIAYAAAKLIEQPNKIRCYRTFADDWVYQALPLAA